uniref:Asialoglycoprotein receptor 2 n=1 Tax=Canis lupus familiaris TaxID=9615 RepID=A0A8C0PYA3_CANLF
STVQVRRSPCSSSDTPSPAGLPPHQPLLLQRLCSGYRLNLLVLGFNVLMLVAICVIGSQREGRLAPWGMGWCQGPTRALRALRGARKRQRWDNRGGGQVRHPPECVQRACVCASPASAPHHALPGALDHATLLLHLKHFPSDLRILTCQVAFFQSNGTDCCPVNWLEYEGSCYWFSRSGKTWEEAEKHCQLESAHLVVVNSREEQKFILQHTNPFDTWIGLTDSDGSWRWVDGTDYQQSYKNWAATQPDDWQGHEVGGGEDCAEVRANGRWNDNFCKQVQRWVCEMRRNVTG